MMYYLHEGRFKHTLRLLGFSIRNSLPYEALVNKGEKVIMVGTPSECYSIGLQWWEVF